MRFHALLLLSVALAARHQKHQEGLSLNDFQGNASEPEQNEGPEQNEEPEQNEPGIFGKVWRALGGAYEPNAVISFSTKPYDMTGFFRTAWTALPLSMYEGDLVISGPVYRIIKLLEERELPISCPTLWADRGYHVYLAVTKPASKVSSALTKAAVKITVDFGGLVSFLSGLIHYPLGNLAHVTDAVVKQSEAFAAVAAHQMRSPTPADMNTTFHKILHRFHQAKEVVMRASVEERVVRLMLGPKYLSGTYDLKMTCVRRSEGGAAYVHFPHHNTSMPVTTSTLAVYILAVA